MSPITHRFTAEEDTLLSTLWAEGLTLPAIAERLGRRVQSVRARRRHLKLAPQPVFWTEERNREFRACWEEGLTVQQLADRFGISFDAAQSHRQVLKLPHRKPGQKKQPPKQSPKHGVELRNGIPRGITLAIWRPRDHHSDETKAAAAENAATAARAIAHARRCAALPPVTREEADRLVAAALAAGRLTRCPAVAVATINQGDGYRG